MKGRGKVRLLKPGTGTIVRDKEVERSIITEDGGEIVVRVKRNDDGDLLISRRLAKILFNKDWGKRK